MWEMLVFLLHGRNKDASLPQAKDLHLMATVLLFLSCKSSVICSPSACTMINLERQRGRRLMAQVSLHHLCGKASLGSVCKAWGPAGCAFCSKQYFTVFGGKSRISLGHGIIIGVCLWDLCCSGNVFCRNSSTQVGTWWSAPKRLAAFVIAALARVARNAHKDVINKGLFVAVLLKYEEQCSLKSEMLRFRSWYSVPDSACASVS